jgi:hypothetical protein
MRKPEKAKAVRLVKDDGKIHLTVRRRSTSLNEEETGQEDRDECDPGSDKAIERWSHDGAQISREGEKRSGDGLRHAVASQEVFVRDPSRCHHLLLE